MPPTNKARYRSRKFFLAVSAQYQALLGLGLGWLEEGSFVAVTGLVLGLYGAANVVEVLGERKKNG